MWHVFFALKVGLATLNETNPARGSDYREKQIPTTPRFYLPVPRHRIPTLPDVVTLHDGFASHVPNQFLHPPETPARAGTRHGHHHARRRWR